ncbi:MAG TPA: sulfotransferase [Rhizomicrobium sp.]|nr:sulfotransferase [Rhizomicrobium sp.]
MSTLQDALGRVERSLRAGHVAEAMRTAHEAVGQGLAHPGLLTLAAQQEIESGNFEKALALAERACTLAPRDGDALRTKAMALGGLGRKLDALAAYDQALAVAPGTASAHYDKGLIYLSLFEQQLAHQAFESTIALRPAHAGALAELASITKTRGDAVSARAFAERALRVRPGQIASRIVLAELDLDARDFDAARKRLDDLLAEPGLSAVNRSIVLGLLADTLDGQGKQGGAFLRYGESNALLKQHYRSTFEAPGVERAVTRATRLAAFLRDAPEARWRDCPPGSDRSSVDGHVFLVGFPRSGTTLLEQVLAGHGFIEAVEERGTLTQAMTDFIAPTDGMDRLQALEGDDLARYRDAYWQEARAGGAKLDRVFVDKMPLNVLNLGLVAKLFPQAKVILALRDPRDVVLSCFRRRFQMLANMYELLDLDDAARFYDAVMSVAEAARGKLTLPMFDQRYEAMVADLEGQARRLCDFLGVPYDARMLDFKGTAQDRAIATPSGAQIARGLYNGEGQWRAYKDQMESVAPILAPWVERYGYAKS